MLRLTKEEGYSEYGKMCKLSFATHVPGVVMSHQFCTSYYAYNNILSVTSLTSSRVDCHHPAISLFDAVSS